MFLNQTCLRIYRRNLSTSFENAVIRVSLLKSEPSSEKKLELYALYKQATLGPCAGKQPNLLDFTNRAKFDAWKALGMMSKEDAEKKYAKITDEFPLDEFHSSGVTVSKSGAEASTGTAVTDNGCYTRFRSLESLAFPYKQSDSKQLLLKSIKTEVDNHVMKITLNRPEKRNAFNMQMWNDLLAAFEAATRDDQVRIAVLTGADGHFSSGMDLSVFAEMQKLWGAESCEARRREGLSAIIHFLQDAVSAAESCRVPVVAAISGVCIGGAVDVVCACDLRFCTADARFSIRETDLAMVADIGTLQRLPHIIGDQRTRELAYTGREVTGEEAASIGLVLRCFQTADEMWAHVEGLTSQVAQKSPLAIRGVKRAAVFARDHTVAEGLEQVQRWNTSYLHGEDLGEAMRATMSKTKAEFKKG